jgi:hypothetical protein
MTDRLSVALNDDPLATLCMPRAIGRAARMCTRSSDEPGHCKHLPHAAHFDRLHARKMPSDVDVRRCLPPSITCRPTIPCPLLDKRLGSRMLLLLLLLLHSEHLTPGVSSGAARVEVPTLKRMFKVVVDQMLPSGERATFLTGGCCTASHNQL